MDFSRNIKWLTERFLDAALIFFGVSAAPIVRLLPTEHPSLELGQRILDMVLELTDGSIDHLESWLRALSHDFHLWNTGS